MPVKFRCQHCKKLLGISSRKIGQIVDCPGCGRSVRVPAEDGVGKAAPPPEFDVNDPAIVLALDELASITKQPHALRPSAKASPHAEDDGWLEPEEAPEPPTPAIAPPPPAPPPQLKESTPTAYRPAPPTPPPRREPVALAPKIPEVRELPPAPAPRPVDPPDISHHATLFPAPPPEPRQKGESSADRSDYSDHALSSSIPELAVTATTVGPMSSLAAAAAPLPNPSLLVSAELRRLATTPDPDQPQQPEVRYHYISQPAQSSKLPVAFAGAGGLLVGLILGYLGAVFLRPPAALVEKPPKPVAGETKPAETPAETRPTAVTGRLKYRKQGNLKPDEGAIVLFLPLGRPEGEKLSSEGLRPGDAVEDRDKATRRLQVLGGGLAVVTSDGSYSASLPAPGGYAVVALSANQPRDPESSLSPYLKNVLDLWFDGAHDLLGERAVTLDELSYDGMSAVTWDYSFDAH